MPVLVQPRDNFWRMVVLFQKMFGSLFLSSRIWGLGEKDEKFDSYC